MIDLNEEIAMTKETDRKPKLVDAKGLLESLFDPEAQPSLRWIRQMQAQRKIPYLKIGHLVFFDIDEVRDSLTRNCLVKRR